jgi:hypothetical protein
MTIYFDRSWADMRFRVLTNEEDVLRELHGFPHIVILGPSTSSPLSFSAAREWLRECLDCHHPNYGPPAHEAQNFRRMFCGSTQATGIGPSRVLDCSPDPSAGGESTPEGDLTLASGSANSIVSSHEKFAPSCKLVNLAETDGRYAALSYCWGTLDYKSFVITENNVTGRREFIDETELPQVFQDAILVARNLGIRYLWIDTFCILQDWSKPAEDQADWIEESAKMADIFSNALITVFAASAVGSEGGLFNENSSTAFDNPDISFDHGHTSCASTSAQFIHSNGKTSVLHFVEDERLWWTGRKPLRESCLERRVWCYQEDLLSPRKLYYCRDQLYWYCDHVAASEDQLLHPTKDHYGDHPLKFFGLSLDPHTPNYAAQMSRFWYLALIGTGYRAQGATHERDRLIAVSGLAKRIGAATKSRYLAGLWEASVIDGLLWRVASQTSWDTKTDVAPSWSWASQQGDFIYIPYSAQTPVCRFIRADVDYFNPRDLFGAVKRAALTLQGRLLSTTLKNEFYELPLLDVALHHPAWDHYGLDLTNVCIMALPLNFGWGKIHLLLITTSASDSSRYIRVGVADVRLSGVVDALDFDGLVRSVPETEITLI